MLKSLSGLLAGLLLASPSFAQATDEPPAPVPPEVVSRDAEGHVTVRAVRIVEGLVIDGRLGEKLYEDVPAISDFIQQEPREGEPATEKTEAWIFFDDRNIYVAARCWDSHPERMVSNDMRRDGMNLTNNENFGVIFDTFHDRRSGFLFHMSATGGMSDMYVTDERNPNRDWNTVWEGRTARFDHGWTLEMAIPFKSLRYAPGALQTWGLNLRRIVRWKNEWSYLTKIPAQFDRMGIMRVSSAATLVGIEPPRQTLNLEVKPYAIGGVTSDVTASPAVSNDLTRDAGFDVKYGITRGLTADFTYNTDFAQVETDEQQVNLTRFGLFFPEKREFFLEGQGIFAFGSGGGRGGPGRGGGGGGGGYGGGGGDGFGGAGDTPVLFFSRRIGLQDELPVPIEVGGRVTGKAGKYSVGALSIRTSDEPRADALATNFAVVRVKRDVLRRSSIGAIFTSRSRSTVGNGSNEAVGVDANFSFFENLNIASYLAKTRTPGLSGDDLSYRARFDYDADRYGVQLEHLGVGDRFNPEVGFLRRDNFRRSFASLRFSPRPRERFRAVRKFIYEASYDYITNGTGRLESREVQGQLRTEFQSSDAVTVEYSRNYEFLLEAFEITPGVTLPIGGYSFQSVRANYMLGQQRRVAGWLTVEHGGFYNGSRTAAGYRGRVELSPQFSLEPGVSINWVDLPEGAFTTQLTSARVTYSVTPRMFVGALIQYSSSSSSLITNARWRWEYRPGSELFVVYSDGRDTLARGFPALENRGLVFKINRLFRF